tara:strand:- start:142 stop:762 length:621 start_codon:yes stop_codon:yes gene_type:complete
MPTPQNRQLTKGAGGENSVKQNYTGHRLGTNDGEIRFGQIDKEGTVTSGCYLNAKEGTHVLTMDNDGPRKGWTTSISPGHLQMQCGRDSTKEEDSCVIYADNGNIVINAGNGNMRFIANNFEFTAQGEDGTEGNFKVEASQSIILDAKKIQCTAKNFLKLATPGKMEICANENLKLYGGVIRGITNAVSKKDGKLGGQSFWKEQQP